MKNLNEINKAVPDPKIIGEQYLKNAAIEKNTGLVCAYDPTTQAGGIIHPDMDEPRWLIFMPISEADFAVEVNKTAAPILDKIGNQQSTFH